MLEGVQNFTVMIKNSVEFPDCFSGKAVPRWRNIPTSYTTPEELGQCRHNIKDKKMKMCPIFKLGNIANWAHEARSLNDNFSTISHTVRIIKLSL